jgi:hypothetical protein
MRQWATRKKCKFVYLRLDNFLRAVDPHCFDADPEPEPDPVQNLDANPDPDPDPDPGGRGGGGRSAKNVHPPWQNPRCAPGWGVPIPTRGHTVQ